MHTMTNLDGNIYGSGRQPSPRWLRFQKAHQQPTEGIEKTAVLQEKDGAALC